jgi:hypothetical protein
MGVFSFNQKKKKKIERTYIQNKWMESSLISRLFLENYMAEDVRVRGEQTKSLLTPE